MASHLKYWRILLFVTIIIRNTNATGTDSDISCSVDLSRKGCSNPSKGLPLPIYVYPTPFHYEPQQVHPYLQHIMIWLSKSKGKEAYQVDNPDDACLFLITSPAVALCNNQRIDCGYYEYWQNYPFDSLSHWFSSSSSITSSSFSSREEEKGVVDGGMNHMIYMPSHTDWEVTSYPTGKAMLLRSASTERSFWPGVDTQLPFYTPVCNHTENQPCVQAQQVLGRGPKFLPDWAEHLVEKEDAYIEHYIEHEWQGASSDSSGSFGSIHKNINSLPNRTLLGGFVGAIRLGGPYVVPAPDLTVGNRLRVAMACLHSPITGFVVADTYDEFDLDPSSHHLEPDIGVSASSSSKRSNSGGGGQWRDYYWRTLLHSHYALCPSGAGAHSQRINEAIAAGAVPVNIK
jgi:hypothetical protein